MKGSAMALLAVIFAFLSPGLAMEPIESPVQYGQFCNNQKVSGRGFVNISTSIEDGDICLWYYNSMEGNGEIEVDQDQAYSQKAEKLQRKVDSINETSDSSLNLFEKLKLTYSGKVPLKGEKSLTSAIGATIEENFAVNEMETDQMSFSTSTRDDGENETAGVKENTDGSSHTPVNDPVHTMGIDTRSTFSGKWGTDATWKEMLSKDLKAHEAFKGNFEVDKLIKFHEHPAPEEEESYCSGIDC